MVAIRPVRVSQFVLVVAMAFPLAGLCWEASDRTAKARGTNAGSVGRCTRSGPIIDRRAAKSYSTRWTVCSTPRTNFRGAGAALRALLPALGEELFFRGFLGRGLVARYGPILGVLLTTLLFALFHIDPVRIASAAVMGVVFHWVYLMTRSLAAPILLHTCYNALCIAAAKVWTAYQFNLLGLTGGEHFPSWHLIGSALAVAAITWALYRTRSRWVLPDGSVWSPGYVSAEMPPPEKDAAAATRQLGIGSALTLTAAGVAFIAVVALGLENTRAIQLAARTIDAGNELLRSGNYAAAAEKYSEAIQLAPKEPMGYANRGLATFTGGNPSGALPDLNFALSLNPELADAYATRVRVFMSLGRTDEIASRFQHTDPTETTGRAFSK